MVYLVWCTAFELRHQTQMEWHFYECAFFALLLKSIRKDDLKEQRTKDYDFFVCIFFVVHQYRYWSLCKLIHTFMMFYYCRCITKMTKSNRIFFVLPQKIHYFAYFTLNDEDIEKKKESERSNGWLYFGFRCQYIFRRVAEVECMYTILVNWQRANFNR